MQKCVLSRHSGKSSRREHMPRKFRIIKHKWIKATQLPCGERKLIWNCIHCGTCIFNTDAFQLQTDRAREREFSRSRALALYMKRYTLCQVSVSGKKTQIYCPFSLIASNKRHGYFVWIVKQKWKHIWKELHLSLQKRCASYIMQANNHCPR